HVDCKEVAIRIELVEGKNVIHRRVFGLDDFASANVDPKRNFERSSVSPECSQPFRDGRRPFIVETQSIDERFVRGQAVKPGFGIARLGQGGYSSDLDETETKPGYSLYCDSVLIETPRQPHRIGKSEGTNPDMKPVVLHAE